MPAHSAMAFDRLARPRAVWRRVHAVIVRVARFVTRRESALRFASMPRLEVPVRTPLRFVKGAVVPLLDPSPELASVVIEFDGREFGWLANAPRSFAGIERQVAPTVTTMIDVDDEAALDEAVWDAAREPLQRLLSALAFRYDVQMASAPSSGGSGTPSLLHPHGAFVVDDSHGYVYAVAPSRVVVAPCERLRLVLAVYREGQNASSPFYRFLAFWNVLDTVFDGDESKRDAFINVEAPKSTARVPISAATPAEHFRDESRHAIAHVIRRKPTDRVIDPDLPPDRERLDLEEDWLRELARKAILERWPTPVTLEPAASADA
jgi:Methylamine utilization protein MauJ